MTHLDIIMVVIFVIIIACVIETCIYKNSIKYVVSCPGNDKDYVFKNTKREQIKYDSIAKAHKLICKKAGIRIVTFHCLRHTFATRAIESGIDYKTVSEILGHSKPSTTINLYVHSTNDSKREAAELISELINELSIL